MDKPPCAYCGQPTQQANGAINRALKIGAPIYCDKTCAGLGRRKNRSEAEKRELKRQYDAKRRVVLADEIKAAKAEYHKRTYDPVAAAVHRKTRMPKHVEYCRRPEYRAYKREYDRKYRAVREFGEFAECFMALQDVENEISSRMTKYEIYAANGRLNLKNQRRLPNG